MITNPDHDHPINYLSNNTDSSLVSPVSLLTDRSVYTDSQKGQNAHVGVLSHTIVGVLPQLKTVEVSKCCHVLMYTIHWKPHCIGNQH